MRAAAAMTDPTHSGGPRSSDPYPSQPASSGQLVPELVSEDLVMEALPLIDPIARGVRVQLGGALPLDDLRADPADELSPAAKKEVMDNAAAALAALASG